MFAGKYIKIRIFQSNNFVLYRLQPSDFTLWSGPVKGQEDCLVLNIHIPASLAATGLQKSLPVMVWIHGGGFRSGSGSPDFYGPQFILDKDVVSFDWLGILVM